jgi:hypothetical protein
LKHKPAGLGSRIEVDNRARPLTRGQLDIWLAQDTGHSGKEWQLGVRSHDSAEMRRFVRLANPNCLIML